MIINKKLDEYLDSLEARLSALAPGQHVSNGEVTLVLRMCKRLKSEMRVAARLIDSNMHSTAKQGLWQAIRDCESAIDGTESKSTASWSKGDRSMKITGET